MATKPTPRVRMPATAKAGEVVEVKTLISHEMESGQRKDKDGKATRLCSALKLIDPEVAIRLSGGWHGRQGISGTSGSA